ncbi:MAG: hypothetical protein JXP34_08805, partial [Planctomycetes bacterium]|nr:hypothetical protein [Planctomycetota bacterium]
LYDAEGRARTLVQAQPGTPGAALERYEYTPYGHPTFLRGDFTEVGASVYGNVVVGSGTYYDQPAGIYLVGNQASDPLLGARLQAGEPKQEPQATDCGEVCAGDQCELKKSCFQLTTKHCKCIGKLADQIASSGGSLEWQAFFIKWLDLHRDGSEDVQNIDPVTYADEQMRKAHPDLETHVAGSSGKEEPDSIDVGCGEVINVKGKITDECSQIEWHLTYHHEQQHNCDRLEARRMAEKQRRAYVVTWVTKAMGEVRAYGAEAALGAQIIVRLAHCCLAGGNALRPDTPMFQPFGE